MKNKIFFISLLLLPFTKVHAQDADYKNVRSVNAIITTLYDVISGPAGKDRDWDTFRSLFANDARMYVAYPSQDSGTVLRTMTPGEYAEKNKTRLADMGFNEEEVHRTTESYGAITHVFSTYESHFLNANNEQDTVKGINSIQLFYDGNRYYILSICWDANSKNIPVPEYPGEENQ
jgi:hypothetical protein